MEVNEECHVLIKFCLPFGGEQVLQPASVRTFATESSEHGTYGRLEVQFRMRAAYDSATAVYHRQSFLINLLYKSAWEKRHKRREMCVQSTPEISLSLASINLAEQSGSDTSGGKAGNHTKKQANVCSKKDQGLVQLPKNFTKFFRFLVTSNL